jgi:methyl-accepting chemotaxis protein
MKISIATKFLALCVFLVVLTTAGISTTYYWLTRQDKHRESRQRIQIAFDIILDDFVNRRATYISRLEEFLKENVPLSRAIHFYSRDESQIQSMEFILIHFSQVANDLKKFGRTVSANRLTLYGVNKRLALVYQHHEDQEDVGVYGISTAGNDTYLSLNNPSDRSRILFSNQSIPDTPLPVGVNAHFEGEIPETISADMVNDGQRLNLKIIAPIYRHDSITGVLVCEVFSTQSIVERYALLSKTEVNLFAGNQLSVGTLYTQTQFAPEHLDKVSSCETLLTHDTELEIVPVTFNEQHYYQGQCTIGDSQNSIGAITVSLSQNIEKQEIRKILTAVLTISGLVIALALGLSLVFSRNIVRSIKDVVLTAEMISAGDLTHTIQVQGSGEIRRLTQAFRNMADALRTINDHVKRAGNWIKSSTQDILEATDRLATSLEEQSSSVLETSATMEKVVSASQQISQSTDAVVHIAQKTREDAQQGLRVAEDMLKKMQDIERSNQTDTENIQHLGHKSIEISKIMEVIATIADQTKLIAFNASLEAAGAGSAGRRFGVVAEEIRHLADSVIGSTVTIRQTLADIQTSVQALIVSSENSTRNIHEGVEYTILTTKWLKEILNGTAKTTSAAQKIAHSILGQQLAGEEISAALKELSINTHQFAEAGALNRDIANQLKALAEDLEEATKALKL